MHWAFLGQIPYQQAWEYQKSLRQQRIAGLLPDTLLLLEHPPTITLGRHRGEKSLRANPDFLQEQGIELLTSDRGGDATLHAPGQLVGYLIVHLGQLQRSLPAFVHLLAQAFVDFLRSFQLQALYQPKFPGVWLKNKKIVAFGFHVQHQVTMHGFAFNLQNDLSLFDWIVPCGLTERGVTSLQQLRPQQCPSPQQAAPQLAQHIAHRLQRQRTPLDLTKWPLPS